MTVEFIAVCPEVVHTTASEKNDERERIYLFMFDGIFSRETEFRVTRQAGRQQTHNDFTCFTLT